MKLIFFVICIFPFSLLSAKQIEIGLGKKSFSDFYLEQLLNDVPKKSFNENFLSAVKLFESKDAHKSYRLFREITDTAYQYDWGPLERKAIAYSFLRLAEQDPNLEQFYINEALKFSAKEEIYLDNFNAGIKEKILFQEHSKSIPISLFHFLKEPSYVLLNGKKVPPSKFASLKLPRGKLRLSIISNQTKPFHFVGTRSKLLSGSVGIKSLDWGSCLNPKMAHDSLTHSEFKITFHRQCELSYKSGAFERHQKSVARTTSEILYPPTRGKTKQKSDALGAIGSVKTKSKITAPWKKYVWWGLGLLAGAYIVEQNKPPKKVIYK